MTTPFRSPTIAARRPSYADLTLHLGDGKTVMMRIGAPMVEITRGHDDYIDPISSRYDPLSRYVLPPSRVCITLDGHLENPGDTLTPATPPPTRPPDPPPEPPALTVRTIADLPGLTDLVPG